MESYWQLYKHSVSFILGIILARLLKASDNDFCYGHIIPVISGLLSESGFGLALVRKPEVTQEDLIFCTSTFLLHTVIFTYIPKYTPIVMHLSSFGILISTCLYRGILWKKKVENLLEIIKLSPANLFI